jgi:hypothetical protein
MPEKKQVGTGAPGASEDGAQKKSRGRTATGAGTAGGATRSARATTAQTATPEAGRAASAGRGPGRAKKPDLKKDLREFASARPQGWDHQDWINFLEALQSRGHDVHDRDSIGLALEKERLDLALSGIKGVPAQKRKGLVERFGTTWKLRNAEVDEIAAAGVDRAVAERIKADLS